MKHHRSTGTGFDEGKFHTFVMGDCFPSEGGQQVITVLFIKETKTKAIGTFMIPNKDASQYFGKAVLDSMSGCGCGCGRAILKSDGEPAIVALQEEVKNSRQSDTTIEDSPKGDSQSHSAAENAVREVHGTMHTWKMSVEEKSKAVVDNKHVLLPWLVSHAGVIITSYTMVHDGKTAYQRSKMLSVGEKIVWMMPKDYHRRNKLKSTHQFGVFAGIVPGT